MPRLLSPAPMDSSLAAEEIGAINEASYKLSGSTFATALCSAMF